MDDEKDVNLDYAFKYFVNFKEKPEHVYFEHTYNQPSHKKYYNGYLNPAKYLFTVPSPNSVVDSSPNEGNEYVDVETVGHSPPLFYNASKINEQLSENDENSEFEDNWMEKVDFRDWNVVKNRLFRSAVQVLEADYFARLANKGLRDEAVKRHLMIKKTAFRLRRIYGSVAWESYTAQWLHTFLLEKLPPCYVKIYTDAFQCLESKIPSHLLEHMPIPSSSLSVRSRILNPDTQNTQKKPMDLFSAALAQHKPKKIIGEPLLVLVPTNMGNNFQPNTRPFRLMSELSLLGTLITVTVPKTASNIEVPTLLEHMTNATISKIIEIQTDYPARPIILVGMDAGALLACHIAQGFSSKITAVVCIGFNIFTMEGKVGKPNDKLLKLRTPLLFIIGQNATGVTIDEMEEFRAKLQCKSGLVIVGGADDHLRVSHYLKMKCSVTQSVVDRCILNEIAEFLNEVIQPPKVVVSIISSSDSSKTTATVSSADAQLLKQILSETVKKSKTQLIKKIIKPGTSASLTQLDHEYGAIIRSDSKPNVTKSSETSIQLSTLQKSLATSMDSQKRPSPFEGSASLKKIVNPSIAESSNERTGYHRIEFTGASSGSYTYKVIGFNRNSPTNTGEVTRLSSPPVFARKTRGGRRPYVRRTIPPKRTVERPLVLSSYSSVNSTDVNAKNENNAGEKAGSTIENLTPDRLLDLPIVFAEENDEENVINDVSLTSYGS